MFLQLYDNLHSYPSTSEKKRQILVPLGKYETKRTTNLGLKKQQNFLKIFNSLREFNALFLFFISNEHQVVGKLAIHC